MPQATTSSEAYLTTLARKAFLHLWTHANVFIKKGGAKELCDLLLIFGDDVVIFSDKECQLDQSSLPTPAWRRWYRRAVLSSARQVIGAERNLMQGAPLYRDRACAQPLHVRMPASPRVHRVLTVRGAADAARSQWGRNGSLVVTNRTLESCHDSPFRLGATDAKGRFFHVFDQNALDAVLLTLDTAADFLDYLRKRERFMTAGREVIASSEEDLLGAFLFSFRVEENERDFEEQSGQSTIVDSSHWDRWLRSKQRDARDKANEISYAWDKLIERFSFHTIHGTSHYASSRNVAEQEPLLRWFARESRLRRRALTTSLFDMISTTSRGQLHRRHLVPDRAGEPYWVFLVAPQPVGVDHDHYREVRRALLQDHLYVVKHLYPDAENIVGLAVGADEAGNFTEDAAAMDCREWPDVLRNEARRLHEEDGIFRSPTVIGGTNYEYPI